MSNPNPGGNSNDGEDAPMLPKKRFPTASAFRQQRLPTSEPEITAGTVYPKLFPIGILFIAVGIGLLYMSNMVDEQSVNYTFCTTNETTSTDGNNSLVPCAEVINRPGHNFSNPCVCNISFTLNTDLDGTVFMYYGLTDFYQNHRHYLKSRDDDQLLGNLDGEPSKDCEPFREAVHPTTQEKVFIFPCGAIANSLFNDNLTLSYEQKPNEYVPVKLLRTGIAWPSDKEHKFRNPKSNLKTTFEKFAKPPNWIKNIWELDTEDETNNGLQNEDLIVWMRTAALPNFRKLYRRIDHNKVGFEKGLPKGNYILSVEYNYNVTGFGGTKSMILSTTSVLGGQSYFLGIAYIAVGCMSLVFAVGLLIIHIKYGRNTNEMII